MSIDDAIIAGLSDEESNQPSDPQTWSELEDARGALRQGTEALSVINEKHESLQKENTKLQSVINAILKNQPPEGVHIVKRNCRTVNPCFHILEKGQDLHMHHTSLPPAVMTAWRRAGWGS